MSKVQLSPSPKKSLSLILCVVFLAAVALAVVGFTGKNAALTEKATLNIQLEDTLAQLEESKAEAYAKAAELEALQVSIKEREEKAAADLETAVQQAKDDAKQKAEASAQTAAETEAALKAQVDDLTARLSEAETALIELKNQHETISGANAQLTAELAAAQKQAEDAIAQAKASTLEAESAAKAKEEAEAALALAKEQAAAAEQKALEAVTEYEEMQAFAEQLQADYDELLGLSATPEPSATPKPTTTPKPTKKP